ncbi:hypothetical protein GQ43DRAFT_242997 [Delitschia confertaspora ATCC 74209]|uniref:Uncharacterized protein n=1 Tax=Delitschia confertaspora ATCC 74209 TaxID=1513339 RepID=A0A9P4JC02_9PLEO|nr:hypothetical protein GQ43DRAFT_242997 [Delitschia confertaspora ATCC 74209]
MRFSISFIAFFCVVMAFAMPSQSDLIAPAIIIRSPSPANMTDPILTLDKRYGHIHKGKVTSCGKVWMPISDKDWGRGEQLGYESAVKEFCRRVTHDELYSPQVHPRQFLTIYIRYLNDLNGDPQAGKSPGRRVQLTHGENGYIEFEIHNKGKKMHTVNEIDCVSFLMEMADVGSDCYGKQNFDTKGGTYEVKASHVTYHAFPQQD